MLAIPYATTKLPPAPILDLQISAPGDSPGTPKLTALIDTGADFTIVPLQWLLDVHAPESRAAYVRGMWSGRQLVTLYLVDIHLPDGTLSGVEVIGIETEMENLDDEDEIILGRNLLNLLILRLEGIQGQTAILQRHPKRL